MEAIGMGLFLLMKLLLLSSVYAAAIAAVIKICFKKSYFWALFFVAATVLAAYSYTHFGNSGYGDIARLPLSFGRCVEQASLSTYCLHAKEDCIEIDKFNFSDSLLYGAQTGISPVNGEKSYFIIELPTNTLHRIESKTAFVQALSARNISPLPLEDFPTHYHAFWGKRRWFLL